MAGAPACDEGRTDDEDGFNGGVCHEDDTRRLLKVFGVAVTDAEAEIEKLVWPRTFAREGCSGP